MRQSKRPAPPKYHRGGVRREAWIAKRIALLEQRIKADKEELTALNRLGETLTPKLREFLEWSAAYGFAEGFLDDTTRHNAQAIQDGVMPFSEYTERSLLEAYRIDGHEDDAEWQPETDELKAELAEALKTIESREDLGC